jgi:hypothetical protein
MTIAGIIVLLVMVKGHPGACYFAPGLFLIGLGVGVMLTPSVNVVQSAFPENVQGEISGVCGPKHVAVGMARLELQLLD